MPRGNLLPVWGAVLTLTALSAVQIGGDCQVDSGRLLVVVITIQ